MLSYKRRLQVERRSINKIQVRLTLGIAVFIILWIIGTTFFATRQIMHFQEIVLQNSRDIQMLQIRINKNENNQLLVTTELIKISKDLEYIKKNIDRINGRKWTERSGWK